MTAVKETGETVIRAFSDFKPFYIKIYKKALKSEKARISETAASIVFSSVSVISG